MFDVVNTGTNNNKKSLAIKFGLIPVILSWCWQAYRTMVSLVKVKIHVKHIKTGKLNCFFVQANVLFCFVILFLLESSDSMALLEGNFQSWFDFNDFRIPPLSVAEPSPPPQQLEKLEKLPTTVNTTGSPGLGPVTIRKQSKKMMMTEEDLMDQVQMDASHITMKKNMLPYRERQ